MHSIHQPHHFDKTSAASWRWQNKIHDWHCERKMQINIDVTDTNPLADFYHEQPHAHEGPVRATQWHI